MKTKINIKKIIFVGIVLTAVTILIWLNTSTRSADFSVHVLKESQQYAVRAAGYSTTADSIKTACSNHDIPFPPPDLSIIIDKSDFKLYLYSKDKVLKEYPVSLGKNTKDDKIKRGDNCTPEGTFFICQKVKNPNKLFLGTRWLRISYPNKEDAERGIKNGMINKAKARKIIRALDKGQMPLQDTKLGGAIGIHGGGYSRFGKTVNNWTAGCIGLYDKDVEEFYDYLPAKTRVEIRK